VDLPAAASNGAEQVDEPVGDVVRLVRNAEYGCEVADASYR